MPTKKQSKKDAHLAPPLRASHDLMDRWMLDVLRTPPEQFYIKHPPADASIRDYPDNLPNLWVFALEGEILNWAAHLRAVQKEYRETGNGVCLVSAFLLAHECKLYPPMWVLNGLAAAFKNYWKAPEKKPLDTWLGLQQGRGREPGFKALARRARDSEPAYDMWLLMHRFGLTTVQAAEAVTNKLEASPLRNIRWGRGLSETFTADSLAKLYSCKWKRKFGLTKEYYDLVAPHCPPKFWRGFLKTFPTRDLRAAVKAKLRLD